MKTELAKITKTIAKDFVFLYVLAPCFNKKLALAHTPGLTAALADPAIRVDAQVDFPADSKKIVSYRLYEFSAVVFRNEIPSCEGI